MTVDEKLDHIIERLDTLAQRINNHITFHKAVEWTFKVLGGIVALGFAALTVYRRFF